MAMKVNAEYVNSYNRNYLKIKPEGELRGKLRYQYQILTNRKMDGILQADFHIHNGESGLYYDISGKLNLVSLFAKRKVTAEFMNQLVGSLQTALWSLEQYLLSERNLLLHPEFIYQDLEKDTFQFLYVPYFTELGKADQEPFLSFLLEKADMDDSEMADAVFGLYSKWEEMGDEFQADSILRFWPGLNVKEGEKGKAESPLQDAQVLPLVNEENLMYEETGGENEEKKLYGNGRQNRRVITLDKLPVIIGRKPEYADIIINDASVEKMHVKVVEEEGHIYMEDLNAATGTFKNGVQLRPYERVELLREDEIKLGKLSFTYR